MGLNGRKVETDTMEALHLLLNMLCLIIKNICWGVIIFSTTFFVKVDNRYRLFLGDIIFSITFLIKNK